VGVAEYFLSSHTTEPIIVSTNNSSHLIVLLSHFLRIVLAALVLCREAPSLCHFHPAIFFKLVGDNILL
jgi:hypothetical protein